MLPLLTAAQIREADAYTIAHKPITSIDLTERASKVFAEWFINHFPDKAQSITVYCGTGNNGGDGLAIARILNDHEYKFINIKVARFSDKCSDNFNINLNGIKQSEIPFYSIEPGGDIPANESQVIIDALLGSGLNKPLEGDYKKLVTYINSLNKTVIAVDIPTGFFADGEIPTDAIVLKAGHVITFQQPKINFLLPESAPFIKCWESLTIGIDESFVQSLNSPYQLTEEKDIQKMLKPRHRFSNKGSYGHALIIAGQAETMGAALLCSAASALSGSGLTTACIPGSGLTALNSYMPEIMVIVRTGDEVPEIDWSKFNAIAVGPGLGKQKDATALLLAILNNYNKPVVFDADALNLLADEKNMMSRIPENSIITPHMKEFDRLFGEHNNWWLRMQTGIEMAKQYKIYILLKNDYTLIITPRGKVHFNSTSNPAMATGGMGDVLTGIITSLLAQQYSPEEACIIAAYIHGKAGDELALPNCLNVLMPGLLAAQLPITMVKLMV